MREYTSIMEKKRLLLFASSWFFTQEQDKTPLPTVLPPLPPLFVLLERFFVSSHTFHFSQKTTTKFLVPNYHHRLTFHFMVAGFKWTWYIKERNMYLVFSLGFCMVPCIQWYKIWKRFPNCIFKMYIFGRRQNTFTVFYDGARNHRCQLCVLAMTTWSLTYYSPCFL